MAKLTFKLESGKNKTNVRISKYYYPYEFIEYLKTKSDFEYKGTNTINHVFTYLGTVENAEFNLKNHYTVFKNMNKKLNQNKEELKTIGNDVELRENNRILRSNNRILLNERNDYMELVEKQTKMIAELEKDNKKLQKLV